MVNKTMLHRVPVDVIDVMGKGFILLYATLRNR